VGQSGDGGIDLQGTWHLPDKSYKMLIQCKHLAYKVGPTYIRELEGVIAHYNLSALNRGVPTFDVAMFVCENGYSKGALQFAGQSTFPLILVSLG